MIFQFVIQGHEARARVAAHVVKHWDYPAVTDKAVTTVSDQFVPENVCHDFSETKVTFTACLICPTSTQTPKMFSF